jgi:serine/threonine protein kinase
LANTLQAIHNDGIVHRDVRPDNIVFIPVDDDVNQVKLIDFSFACRRNTLAPYSGATHFVSPRVADHLKQRSVGGGDDGDASFMFTAGDDLYSWMLVCVWMHSRAQLAAAFHRFDRLTDVSKKQRLIRQMFNQQLATPTWCRLRDAVQVMISADAAAADCGEQLFVDYSPLHVLIPLPHQLKYSSD